MHFRVCIALTTRFLPTCHKQIRIQLAPVNTLDILVGVSIGYCDAGSAAKPGVPESDAEVVTDTGQLFSAVRFEDHLLHSCCVPLQSVSCLKWQAQWCRAKTKALSETSLSRQQSRSPPKLSWHYSCVLVSIPLGLPDGCRCLTAACTAIC